MPDEICVTISDTDPIEAKVNIESNEDACNADGLICIQYDDPWIYDGSWSYC